MYVERESEKALLVVRDAVPFWIRKRWIRADGTLTKAGWKAYHIAKRTSLERANFDAMKEFEVARETDKAVLLRCAMALADGSEERHEFWLPKSMARNFGFVSVKVREVEERHPFTGVYVKWSGRTVPKQGGRAGGVNIDDFIRPAN